VVMHGGRILETGSHAALIAAGGAYAELIRRWNARDDRDAEPLSPA
jgi:ABC-type multidrug transport system fused ATPase/permease subunit